MPLNDDSSVSGVTSKRDRALKKLTSSKKFAVPSFLGHGLQSQGSAQTNSGASSKKMHLNQLFCRN